MRALLLYIHELCGLRNRRPDYIGRECIDLTH